MATTVLAYNIKDGFNDSERAPRLMATFDQVDPDVAVFSEAYAVGNFTNCAEVAEDFHERGYMVSDIGQDVEPDRGDLHGLVVVARNERVQRIDVVQLAGRYALAATMKDEETDRQYRFVGAHGDDRSEQSRLASTEALLDYLEAETDMPTVYAGDLNTMRRGSMVARALRLARPAALLLPSAPPDPGNPTKGLKRVGSLAQRVTAMAKGGPLELLGQHGFYDADPTDTPTMIERGLAVKLDHIMLSGMGEDGAGRHFHVEEHTVHAPNAAERAGLYDPASDHRAISARLRLISPE